MFTFNYDIELSEDGRPYIVPVNGTEKELALVEHKYMSIELVRGLIGTIIQNTEKNDKNLPSHELDRLKFLEIEMTKLSEIFKVTIKEQFELSGYIDKIINKNFDVTVLTENERDGLNYNGFIYDDQIFRRKEGLKVKVIRTGQVFELQGGIDNEHWKAI